jgi:hypothetical protein
MTRASGRYSSRTLYKTVDAEVEIEFDDVIEYIEDYASKEEIAEILEAIREENIDSFLETNTLDSSYIREEKATLLSRAAKKFTLQELEEKLGGNKFDFV